VELDRKGGMNDQVWIKPEEYTARDRDYFAEGWAQVQKMPVPEYFILRGHLMADDNVFEALARLNEKTFVYSLRQRRCVVIFLARCLRHYKVKARLTQ
jgi:hypothetical protein